MKQSLIEFKTAYIYKITNILWRQWTALGVPGTIDVEDKGVVDPEALIPATCLFGRYDSRLFDEMLNWLYINGKVVNIQRLKNIIAKEMFVNADIIPAIAEFLNTTSKYRFLKWKKILPAANNVTDKKNFFYFRDGNAMEQFGPADAIFEKYGYLRGPVKLREHTLPVYYRYGSDVIFKLRALFGVRTRADIVLYLLTHEYAHPREIARDLYYAPKSVQDILIEMSNSGLVNMRPEGKEKQYFLDKTRWHEFLKLHDRHVEWITWPAVFRALEIIWLKISGEKADGYSKLLLSSVLREVMDEVKYKIEAAGINNVLTNPKFYLGEQYVDVFFADMNRLFEKL
ncbi:MAG: helix-turn-helix transcriptional regulator [Elusimicrobiota bacterium]